MRRVCNICGAKIEIINDKVNVVVPFGVTNICSECIKWIESNLIKDPKPREDMISRVTSSGSGNSDIQVIPIKGEAKGKVENDKFLYPKQYDIKIVDTKEAGLAVFNLNAEFVTSADKVRGMYMASIGSADLWIPINLGKQKTINAKFAGMVINKDFPEIQSGISLRLVVQHKGYIEYDVKVDGKLLTLNI